MERTEMAKQKTTFVCQSCGAVTNQWAGRCGACAEWNTIVEEEAEPLAVPGSPTPARKGSTIALESLEGDFAEEPRLVTGIDELDRVLGGGLVAGSAILIGGEPGIGKSTILLQVSAALANQDRTALYFTGEEAAGQVRMRAKRLGLEKSPVKLAAETNLAHILETLKDEKSTDLVIIDSIQTLWSDGLDSAPGTVTQIRAATQMLVRYAKRSGAALLLVGHVTKEGQIAGPKVVEHMVDTVLYFEGDRGRPFRILRTVKNRFGATDEIGVFEMGEKGLHEVANPSALFLGERETSTPGAAVYAGMEGTRPILVEIQALVTPSALGTPRRAVVGWDTSRLSMLLAVLEARCGVNLAGHDVYLNVAGGLKITETAADLAAAAALISSLTNQPLPAETVFFGEISLSGGVRPTGHTIARLKEAQKLGFERATLPATGDIETKSLKISIETVARLADLAEKLGAAQIDRPS